MKWHNLNEDEVRKGLQQQVTSGKAGVLRNREKEA